jgi:hypothetical protein
VADFVFDLRCAVAKCDEPARILSQVELSGTNVKLPLLMCEKHAPGMRLVQPSGPNPQLPGLDKLGIVKK